MGRQGAYVKRTEYHRNYYWANVEKRRKQRRDSKNGMLHKKLRAESSVKINDLMTAWR